MEKRHIGSNEEISTETKGNMIVIKEATSLTIGGQKPKLVPDELIKMEHGENWLKLVPHNFFICQAVMSFNNKKATPKDSLAHSSPLICLRNMRNESQEAQTSFADLGFDDTNIKKKRKFKHGLNVTQQSSDILSINVNGVDVRILAAKRENEPVAMEMDANSIAAVFEFLSQGLEMSQEDHDAEECPEMMMPGGLL